MSGVRVTDRDRGFGKVVRRLQSLRGMTVTVGHHAGSAYPDGTPIAQVAAAHEFGAPSKGIPPRPALGPTADANSKRYVEQLTSLNARMLTGGAGATPEGVAAVFGAGVANDIKRAITTLQEPPLKPATIAAKGSTKPLIDTGALRDGVEARVTKGGG